MQLAGSGPCKRCFTITHRWEQTQQMCEMRKEIYFSPMSMVDLLVDFVALHPISTAMVIAGRSVHLTTLFPGQA